MIDKQFDEVYNQACLIISSYDDLKPHEYTSVWPIIAEEYEFACKVKDLLDKFLEQHNADAI